MAAGHFKLDIIQKIVKKGRESDAEGAKRAETNLETTIKQSVRDDLSVI